MYYNQKIQYIRERKNITQKEISQHLGIKQRKYARYEKGINVMPITYIKEICLYLGVSADFIISLPKNMEYPNI